MLVRPDLRFSGQLSPFYSGFRGLIRSLVDTVYPSCCAVCRRPIGHGFCCAPCLAEIEESRTVPACPRCAADVAPYQLRDGRCPQCRRRRPHLKSIVRVGSYRGSLAEVLIQFKYGRKERLSRVLGDWLSDSIAATSWFTRVEGVLFVPSRWRRRLMRGHYPAEELARRVGRAMDLPLLPILRRVRGGPSQIGLSYAQRVRNVRGAFALTKGTNLQEARLLLIDDVMTTGATLNECAKVLRRGGAAEVYAAVALVAHGRWRPLP